MGLGNTNLSGDRAAVLLFLLLLLLLPGLEFQRLREEEQE
jgi:hypothetical protein